MSKANIGSISDWFIWCCAVALAVFLCFQLSRPLWDAENLINEKRQACEKAGMVMKQEKVKFGTNYYCAAQTTTINTVGKDADS